MPDSPLYKRLKALDAGLAQVYFNLTGDKYFSSTDKVPTGFDASKPITPIDNAGVDKLFKQALNGDKIEPKEVDALVEIVQGVYLTADGMAELGKQAADFSTFKAMAMGGSKYLSTPAELDDLIKALSLASTVVNFTSPKTKLQYNAGLYEAMKQLAQDGEAKGGFDVYAINEQAILPYGGIYLPASKELFYFPAMQKNELTQALVHESTHAIQHFSGGANAVPTKYFEADAYIAQGLVARKLLGTLPNSNPVTGAVEVVAAGKAKPGDKDWMKAYEQAADAAEKAGQAANQQMFQGLAKPSKELAALKKHLADVVAKAAKAAKAAPAPTPPKSK